jgi:hypothetical protein
MQRRIQRAPTKHRHEAPGSECETRGTRRRARRRLAPGDGAGAVGLRQSPPLSTPATLDTTIEAGEPDYQKPNRRLVKWNEYDGPVSTFRLGWGFLLDMATYSQNQESKQQISMSPDVGIRDFRLLFKGKFKTQRPLSWSVGAMYDGTDKKWHFRQTACWSRFPSSPATSSSAGPRKAIR